MASLGAMGSQGGLNPYYVEVLETMAKAHDFVDRQVNWQKERTIARCTMDRWLDENENEWEILDRMCRMRPWATNKDTPFPYPFKEATKEMRESGEALWIGDTQDGRAEYEQPSKRMESAEDVLVCLRQAKEYPPAHRLLLFAPEFGGSTSWSEAWCQREDVDVWAVNWQGWTEPADMVREVYRWVETFADGVSTVWIGHSAGALVAYECLKVMHGHQSPNLPVALIVSGCPAPHLFAQKYAPSEKYPWLRKLRVNYDFENLTTEQIEVMRREFSVHLTHEVDPEVQNQAFYNIPLPTDVLDKIQDTPKPSPAQRRSILMDMKLVQAYQFGREADKPILVPLVAIRSEEDELVSDEDVDAWSAYTTEKFEVVGLEDSEDSELLAELGHGFAKNPPKTMLAKVHQVCTKYQISKDIDADDMLPDVGPTDGPLPDEIDVVIIGAGITGICTARSMAENGLSVVLLEKTGAIGGIWKYYANVYSRVNTSEVGYRIVNQEGPTARPNQDHSPRHDIMRDIHMVAAQHCHGKVRTNWEVTNTEKQPDESYVVTAKSNIGRGTAKVHCKFVMFAVNRRIGKRRDVVYKDEPNFRGDICYGYANELRHLKFWGKRVIVVGAGAFAFENLRTAIEHGAKHVTILGRRSGSTCPKWIDVIAFMRPTDENYNTSKAGNMISFQAWQKCYEDANLPTPECWAEGLLKPHNHTVSVSDLVFIGGYHGMADLKVGEISHFRKDGQGVTLKSGENMDCDIVIKCTGFHLNNDVPKITGKTMMYPSSLIDYNMAYLAEPLLDGGQFGSAKGMVDASELKDQGTEEILNDPRYQAKFHMLPPSAARLFAQRANPFGSGYAGTLMSNGDFMAWLAAHPDKQKLCLEGWGKPRMDMVTYWSSHIGIGMSEEARDVLAKCVKDA